MHPQRNDARAAPFHRDPATLLCYAALAGYAFWLYAFGPALALLRAELHFSYATIGLYSALWAGGAAISGVSFAALARYLHRVPLLWWSAAGSISGAALFAAGHSVAVTMTGAGLLGFCGTTLLTCIQAVLSDRHDDRRDRALTEANVGAAACAVVAPLLLGLFQQTGASWRLAMSLPALLLAGLYLRFRHERLPMPTAVGPAAAPARLPLACWLLAGLVAVGIAVEFCLVYFGTELLTTTGLRPAEAATAMAGFYLGILGGRLGGSWLTRAAGVTVALLWASLVVTAAGFLLAWLAVRPVPVLAGLFVCGAGVANLYPLSVALTLAAAPGNTDVANARTQLVGGLLVMAAPYLLGSVADHLGLHAAFAIEPALIGACGLLLLAGLRTGRAGEPGDQASAAS